MIVTRSLFERVVADLSTEGVRAVDTETTGLRPYQGDKLFSIIIAEHDKSLEQTKAYYFNFLPYDNISEESTLPREWLLKMVSIFDKTSMWFAHNAKFDMHMLSQEGLHIKGLVHCTEAMARVEYNAHNAIKDVGSPYSLAACAHRIGKHKDDAVEEYITKHHLWEWEKVPGKEKPQKRKFFDKVPFEIIHPYGEQDAIATFQLGYWQVDAIKDKSDAQAENKPKLAQVYYNERRLTTTCFKIEKTGVKIDREYCQKASDFEEQRISESKVNFRDITGEDLFDSNKELARIFTKIGEAYPKTEKGNPSFTEDVLETFNTPAAKSLLEYRRASKRANTYFRNYLYFADTKSIIHSGLRQGGTTTGRFSSGDPNLQNVPKRNEEKSEFPVRRAFIPRPGFAFVMLDFDQMEYRLMMEYAGQKDLIDKINSGLDVHTACMELMEMTDRDPAKTLNFMKLYGGGVPKLAAALDIPLEKAHEMSQKYWQALPKVKEFIYGVSNTAKARGFIFNWFGRICYCPNPEWAYALPNHLIQGGCADIMKIAMNKIDDFLEDKKSRMVLQVHDELIFEMHEAEFGLINDIKEILETAYPHKYLKLTTGVEHSFKSWYDKVEGLPA